MEVIDAKQKEHLAGEDRDVKSFQELRCLVDWFMMQSHQLLSLQRNHGIRSAIAIAELNLVNARYPVLDHSSDLTAHQSLLRQVLDQRNYGVHLNSGHDKASSYST
jgi:hypothetical protein